MKLSDDNLNTLMLCLHHLIEQHAEKTANHLSEGDTNGLLVYPPHGGFTRDEDHALLQIESNIYLRSAVRKILASNSAEVMADFLKILDGTSDPSDELGPWSGVLLADLDDDTLEEKEMLNDSFFETYKNWKKLRPEKGWALDSVEE